MDLRREGGLRVSDDASPTGRRQKRRQATHSNSPLAQATR